MRRVKSEIKRGRLSSDEKKRIEYLCETKTDIEIAHILRRPEETVRLYRVEFISNNPGLASKKNENTQIREELHNHHQWASFQKQFTKDELILFENSYVDFASQLKSDLLPLDRKQLFQAITLEIFMDRHNRERMEVENTIQRLQRMIDAEYNAKDPSEMNSAEKDRVMNLEGQLQTLRQSSQSKTKEYKDLGERYSKLMQELKATRDQRLQRAESSKEKMIDIIRMLEEEEIRNRIGTNMVIMEKAVEKERGRLEDLHVYMDNQPDFPLLTPELVEKVG